MWDRLCPQSPDHRRQAPLRHSRPPQPTKQSAPSTSYSHVPICRLSRLQNLAIPPRATMLPPPGAWRGRVSPCPHSHLASPRWRPARRVRGRHGWDVAVGLPEAAGCWRGGRAGKAAGGGSPGAREGLGLSAEKGELGAGCSHHRSMGTAGGVWGVPGVAAAGISPSRLCYASYKSSREQQRSCFFVFFSSGFCVAVKTSAVLQMLCHYVEHRQQKCQGCSRAPHGRKGRGEKAFSHPNHPN